MTDTFKQSVIFVAGKQDDLDRKGDRHSYGF